MTDDQSKSVEPEQEPGYHGRKARHLLDLAAPDEAECRDTYLSAANVHASLDVAEAVRAASQAASEVHHHHATPAPIPFPFATGVNERLAQPRERALALIALVGGMSTLGDAEEVGRAVAESGTGGLVVRHLLKVIDGIEKSS